VSLCVETVIGLGGRAITHHCYRQLCYYRRIRQQLSCISRAASFLPRDINCSSDRWQNTVELSQNLRPPSPAHCQRRVSLALALRSFVAGLMSGRNYCPHPTSHTEQLRLLRFCEFQVLRFRSNRICSGTRICPIGDGVISQCSRFVICHCSYRACLSAHDHKLAPFSHRVIRLGRGRSPGIIVRSGQLTYYYP
jgi:hypothetical protein